MAMREQLLAPEVSPQEGPARRRRGPLRGGDGGEGELGCLLCLAFTVVLGLASSFAALSPNEYGLARSFLSGQVGGTVVRGGLHFTGPFRTLIRFPATQITLQWSHGSYEYPPINTRTGADPNDPDSGGQPVSITCAVQLKFLPEQLRQVYLAFAGFEAAHQRYYLLAGNMVSNTAQEFTPQAFWEHRGRIAARMLSQINSTLLEQGAMATRFEIMKVDFAKSFEDSITQVQVAEQQRVVNEYEQQVQRVVQSIEVMRADNDAAIANISAGAAATAKELAAGATRDAFNLKQGMKAVKYAELQAELGLDDRHMQEYFKIKSVQGQGGQQGGKVVVGLPKIGG